jgi:hypothetical protein
MPMSAARAAPLALAAAAPREGAGAGVRARERWGMGGETRGSIVIHVSRLADTSRLRGGPVELLAAPHYQAL